MPRELTGPDRFGGGALLLSGILFVMLAFLDFRAGPPPSNGAEILLWRDSQACASIRQRPQRLSS